MQESLSHNILRNSFYNFLTTGIGRIGALFFTGILARLLLPEGFGIYTLAVSFVFLFVTILDVGVNSAVLKFVTIDEKEKSAAYFKYIFKIKFLLSLGIGFLLLLGAYPLSLLFNKSQLITPIILSSVYIIALASESFFSSLFYIYNEVRTVMWKEALSQLLRIASLLLIPLLFIREHYISATILSLILTLFIILFFLILTLKRRHAPLFQKTNIPIEKKAVKKFMIYVALGVVSAMFLSYIDVFMLGFFITDPSYVGYYRAATTLVFSIAGILTFSNVLLPKFVQVKKENLQNSFDKVMKYSLALSIPATFGLLVLGRYIIRSVYGYAYLDARYPLFFLSFIVIEAVISGVLYSLVSARGNPSIYTKASLFSLIISLFLTPLFIKLLLPISLIAATTGAALATLISRACYVMMLLKKTKKILFLHLKFPYLLKPMIASSGMVFILLFIHLFTRDMTILQGILEIILGVTVYFLLLLLLGGITKDDIKLLNPKNFW